MYKTFILGRNCTKLVAQQSVNTTNAKVFRSNGSTLTNKDLRNKYFYKQRKKKEMLEELIDINFDVHNSCFVTLTFEENILDIKLASSFWKKFIRNMRLTYEDFRYVATIECQERGSIHYHMICNLVDQTDAFGTIEKYWSQEKNGSVDVQQTYCLAGLAYYTTKQFIRTPEENPLYGRKHYLCSQGLIRPKILRSWKQDDHLEFYSLLKKEPTLPIISEYSTWNERSGVVSHKKFAADNSMFFGEFIYAKKRKP